MITDIDKIVWAADITRRCLAECGGDVEAGLAAAEYIVATQEIHAPRPVDAPFAFDIKNRRAQGILNRALVAGKKLTASARKDLAAALKKDGDALLKFIQKYRVQLAKLLTTTQLAAVLEGAREVADKVPQLVEDAQAIASATGGPPSLPTFPLPAPGGDEDVHFPVIEEATKQLAEKNVLTRHEYDALDAAVRAKSFTVAGVDATDTLTKIRDSLAQSVKEGVDYETWRKKVLADVDQGTFLSDAHQETVYRTVIQTALSDGQAQVLANPLVRSGFPYADYDSIHDDRVRENHLELDTHGIQGSNTYRIDDPVFQTFRPPWDYNCRCAWTPITVRQAAEKGIEEAQKWLETGVEPFPPAFVRMPDFAPPAGFQRAVASAPLSIRLSMQPLATFAFDPSESHNPPTPITEDEYPRDTANRFLDKHTIAEASCDAECAAELRESLPEDQRWKFDRMVVRLQGGGTIYHPREAPGLAVNSEGEIADPEWAEYAEKAAAHEEWSARDADREERRKAADVFLKEVRGTAPSKFLDMIGDLQRGLKDAGASDAEVRSADRMRAKVNRVEASEKLLEDVIELYEEIVESIFDRIEEECASDPEPDEPEEPVVEQSAAFAIDSDKEERNQLVAETLVLLLGEESVAAARDMVGVGEDNQGAALNIALAAPSGSQTFVHPPPGWVHVYTGPRGGKYYSPPGSAAAAAAAASAPFPTPAPRAVVAPVPAPTPKGSPAYRQKLADATAAYQRAMDDLNAGRSLDPQQKAELAKHLYVMTMPQLRTLHAALGGTGSLPANWKPWVFAIKGILSGTPQAAPTPTPAPVPTPAPATNPLKDKLHNLINRVGVPLPPNLPTVSNKDHVEWETGKPQPGTLNGVDFAPAPPEFWKKTKDAVIDEPPPLKPIDRASVVIMEPDGRMWIVKPTNEFGERKYTLPGGSVDSGLTTQQNALKEAWEESGLQVEITGHLGDFKDSNVDVNTGRHANGRLYIGRRVGGAPWDAKVENHIINNKNGQPSAESEAVLLVSPEKAMSLLHRTDDLAQLAFVAPIPVNTPTNGAGSKLMKNILNAIKPKTADYLKKQRADGVREPGNAELHAVQALRGFTKLPTVVKKKDFDALMAKGEHIELLRGVSAERSLSDKEVADEFRTGQLMPRHGVFGSGTYADSTRGSKNVAIGSYSNYGRSPVLRIALPKNAKIIKASELQRKVGRPPDDWKGYRGTSMGKDREDCWLGIQATLAGYDAIEVDNATIRHRGYGYNGSLSSPRGGAFHVLLNRSKLIVQEENITPGYRIP